MRQFKRTDPGTVSWLIWVGESGPSLVASCWMMKWQLCPLVSIKSKQATKSLKFRILLLCNVCFSLKRTIVWIQSWCFSLFILGVYLAFCQHVVSEAFLLNHWKRQHFPSLPRMPSVCVWKVFDTVLISPQTVVERDVKLSSASGSSRVFCGTKMCICSFQVAVLESTLSCEACKNGMPTVSRLLQMP